MRITITEISPNLLTHDGRKDAANRIVMTWRAVGDGNNDKLLVHYIEQVAEAAVEPLRKAIEEHRAQKADDRCIEDDDRLYTALGDGVKCDRRVGDKIAMLHNCAKFIERRCEGGGWYSYAELQQGLKDILDICSVSDRHECADISHIAMNLLNPKPDIS